MKRFIAFAALAAAASTAHAQSVKIAPRATTVFSRDEPNAARIGVFIDSSRDLRDTLGVLVGSVVEEGPAAKAGLKEGDRIASIDGVSLRMTRDDASDEHLQGMMSRRMTRELDKKKAGDEVELRVWSGGQSRSVRVKTVASSELAALSFRALRPASATLRGMVAANNDRASLGASLGGSPSKRDTLGVLIVSVVPDGPAEKAGVFEGDRVARINGLDLRVPGDDAGDADLSRARIRRFTDEIGKLKGGDVVTLTVVSGGRLREVNVTTVKASELPATHTFWYGDGAMMFGPHMELPGIKRLIETHPMPLELRTNPGGIRWLRRGDGNIIIRDSIVERLQDDVRKRVVLKRTT